jgi:hypothetical protein
MHYWHIGKIPCKLTYLEPVEQYLLDGIIGFHNLVVSNSKGPPENTRYPRFDLSEIDYDVNCFIDKGSDVCFHHVWKCVKHIFDCHVYALFDMY